MNDTEPGSQALRHYIFYLLVLLIEVTAHTLENNLYTLGERMEMAQALRDHLTWSDPMFEQAPNELDIRNLVCVP